MVHHYPPRCLVELSTYIFLSKSQRPLDIYCTSLPPRAAPLNSSSPISPLNLWTCSSLDPPHCHLSAEALGLPDAENKFS